MGGRVMRVGDVFLTLSTEDARGVKSNDVTSETDSGTGRATSPSCPPRRPRLGVGRGVGGVQL